ncbi:hypothetical protein [Aurantiacibacter spongiae]|uniref:Uncharacterized protein n=1 Tax=Aurantiacibacter spongiae TaxID=2488860 RepID=A0A3N5CNR8_9SPHN|nr:hypothetical protein [Aurantiacibacter spongiae]RPF70603.1 hypothetical protein EG799_02405 [Aurantiacibacter spongiae]
MDWLLYIVAAVALVSAMAAGLALGMHLLVPGWSERRRALIASLIAGGAPMTLAFGGFFSGDIDTGEDFALGLASLVIVQLVLLAVFALPPAWWVTSRLAGPKAPRAAIDHGESELLTEG